MNHWGRQLKDFVKKKCKGILTISNCVKKVVITQDKIRQTYIRKEKILDN